MPRRKNPELKLCCPPSESVVFPRYAIAFPALRWYFLTCQFELRDNPFVRIDYAKLPRHSASNRTTRAFATDHHALALAHKIQNRPDLLISIRERTGLSGLDFDDRRTWFNPLKHVPDLVLIHLSDIHFNSLQQGLRDRNKDLRNEVLKDLRRQKTHLHGYDAILVTGDIAFAGRADEFQIAGRWLEELCEHLEIDTSNVLVTPGNHDVDRASAECSEVLDLRSRIRAAAGEQLQSLLTTQVTEVNSRLFDPIAEFNMFARRFGCDVNPSKPFWERRFPFNDGSELCVRGMTSTWVSGEGDRMPSHLMVLGEIQCTPERQDGVEYLTMAHHPPSWLLDQDSVNRYLNTRARVQLYGHKHEHWIEQVNHGIRVVAGAVHPERTESNWVPRYNVLTLTVRTERLQRFLDVVVYPRRWSEELTCFIPDCVGDLLPVRFFTFTLDGWTPAVQSKNHQQQSSAGVRDLSAKRRIYYRLATLPFDVQVRIAESLGLLGRGGITVESARLEEELFAAALETNKLEELSATIDAYHGELNRRAGPDGS